MRLQDFHIKQLLGEGKTAKCYLVQYKPSNQLFVLKQIPTKNMSDEQIRYVIRQSQILKILDHKNVIKLHDQFIDQNRYINLVFEYADGGDLSKKIIDSKLSFLTQKVILDWFSQICLAVKYIHDKKVIHRDIKSQNIFITKDGTIKLGDFGVAAVMELNLLKSVVGTPYYMSPQICQNKQYSYKTDIWSLGVLLYQLCTLKIPFKAQSLAGLVLKICKGYYNKSIIANYSQKLKNLIDDMIQVDPDKRPTIENILKNQIIAKTIKNLQTPKKFSKRFMKYQSNDIKSNKLKLAANIQVSQLKSFKLPYYGSPLQTPEYKGGYQDLSKYKKINKQFPLTERGKSSSCLTPKMNKSKKIVNYKSDNKKNKNGSLSMVHINKIIKKNTQNNINLSQFSQIFETNEQKQNQTINNNQQLLINNHYEQQQPKYISESILKTLESIIIKKIGYLKFIKQSKIMTKQNAFCCSYQLDDSKLMTMWIGLKLQIENYSILEK